jgi:hypothetical protein
MLDHQSTFSQCKMVSLKASPFIFAFYRTALSEVSSNATGSWIIIQHPVDVLIHLFAVLELADLIRLWARRYRFR